MTTWKEVLGDEALAQLVANHREQEPLKGTRRERDFYPAARIFLPWAGATWLLTEIDEDGLAFGLADVGMSQPELGYISLDEIWEVSGPGGLKMERDLHWTADKPLSAYADEARSKGYIA